jgi:hypothetical protein
MNKRSMMMVSALSVFWLLVLTVGLTLAQGVGPGSGPATSEAPADTVGNYIPVQGRLTDASGNPINATLAITFRLYAVSSGGVELCHDTNTVAVNNGLFNSQIYGNCAGQMTGQQLYLGMQVGSDAEMAPRQPIYAVPYAWSLKPGAVISGATGSDAVVHIETSSTNGRGLRAYAMAETGTNYGVVGASRSPTGYGGYFYDTAGGIGLKAESDGTALQLTGSGRIESTADSYLFVPGSALVRENEDDTTRWSMQANGSALVWRGGTASNKYIHIPIVVPGVLYGQDVTIRSVTIYYLCENGMNNYITATDLHKQADAATFAVLASETTNRTSNVAASYTLTPTANNVLSSNQGILMLRLYLNFANDAEFVRIGGVRVQLGHQ